MLEQWDYVFDKFTFTFSALISNDYTLRFPSITTSSAAPAAPAESAPAAAPAEEEVHTGLGDPEYDEYGGLEYDEQEGEDEVDLVAANMEVHTGEGDPEEGAEGEYVDETEAGEAEAGEAEADYEEPAAGNMEEYAESAEEDYEGGDMTTSSEEAPEEAAYEDVVYEEVYA